MGSKGEDTSKPTDKTPWQGGAPKNDPEGFKKSIGGTAQLLFERGPEFFDKDLHAGFGGKTTAALDAISQRAGQGGQVFEKALMGAEQSLDSAAAPGLARSNLMGTATGQNLGGNNPFFKEGIENAIEDARRDVGAAFNASGRFGGGSHAGKLMNTAGRIRTDAFNQNYERERDRQLQAINAITGEDQGRTAQQLAISSALPELYEASFMPENKQLSVGRAEDQNTQAELLAQADLFDRGSDFAHLAKFINMNPEAYKEAKKSNPFFDILGLGIQAAPLLL